MNNLENSRFEGILDSSLDTTANKNLFSELTDESGGGGPYVIGASNSTFG